MGSIHSSFKLPEKTLGTLYTATPFSQRRLRGQYQKPTGHFTYFLLFFFSYTKKRGAGRGKKKTDKESIRKRDFLKKRGLGERRKKTSALPSRSIIHNQSYKFSFGETYSLTPLLKVSIVTLVPVLPLRPLRPL